MSMKMAKVDGITPVYMRGLIPKHLKDTNATYFKVDANTDKVLIFIGINVYPAKNKDGIVIERKDGSTVMNATVYAGFEDGTYTTLKNEVALAQALSVVGDLDLNTEGSFEFLLDEPIKTKFTTVKVKRGQKEYDNFAFAPYE